MKFRQMLQERKLPELLQDDNLYPGVLRILIKSA